MRLNLGCGIKKFHLKGWVNVDRSLACEPDLLCDLSDTPWPGPDSTPLYISGRRTFPSGCVSEIRADNLLEHFSNQEFMDFMNEAHRVLEPGGEFWFRVPDAERWPDGAFGDPTHRRYFYPRSFLYFDKDAPQWQNYGRSYGFLPWTFLDLRRVCTNVMVGSHFFEGIITHE